MAKLALVKGSTSQRLYLFIQNSSVTTGAGLTGLAFNSAGLTAHYVRPGGSATAITLATQTVTGAYSSGGFVEVDATNMPGVYRFDVPDAVLATGVDSAVVMLKGATNMAPAVLEIQLTGADLNNATTLGLTNLDATVSSRLASASYTAPPTAAANADAVWDEARGGHVAAGSFGEGVASVQGNVTGSVASVTGAVGSVTGAIGSVAAGGITASSVATGAIDADALSTDAVNEIADGVLDRNMATGTDSGTETTRTVRQALRALRNKVSITTGTATVTKEDDATTSWTAAVATTAGNPISSIDPTSV